MSEVTFSITALVDLLGFSDHLIVGASDIRTEIGVRAVERLKYLEDAMGLIEKEKNSYPCLHPYKLNHFRFNDALFLGIDLKKMSPQVGEQRVPEGLSFAELGKKSTGDQYRQVFAEYEQEAIETAKFLGLVARVHSFVNEQEGKKSFAGCRTVVASGLRRTFKGRKGVEDFFSANLSVSNAYLAAQAGSDSGIRGNNFYVEDNVPRIIAWSQKSKAILAFSSFFLEDTPSDLYRFRPMMHALEIDQRWSCSDPLRIEIL